jgi:linoleoyl-CoA desaturase
VGGLNYQVEHHLFPRIAHRHYPAIAPIVQEVCREFGVPYHSHASVRAALASHWRFLRRLGRPDALAA